MSRCEIEGCGKSAFNGYAIYRTSPMGEPFKGRCYQHLTIEQREDLDPETARIVRIIERSNEP